MLDCIVIADTNTGRARELESVLVPYGRRVEVVKPRELPNLVDGLLADKKGVMCISNADGIENGALKALMEAEERHGTGTRRIIYSCLGGHQVNRLLEENGVPPEKFRHVRYDASRARGSIDRVLSLINPTHGSGSKWRLR